MTPTEAPPALMTAEEFAARYDTRRFELVRGRVVELPMPHKQHGKVCARFAKALMIHVDDHDLGHVMINDTSVQVAVDPDSVRGADVMYISYDRLPRGPVPAGPDPSVPELAAEVVSPSNTWTDLIAKVDEYLAAGVIVVVVIDPDTRTATAYRKLNGHGDDGGKVFNAGDDLTLPDILPGFSVPVRKLFE